MKPVSTLALAAALMAGGAVVTAPAFAQKKKEEEQAQPQRKLKLSKAEQTALMPLQTATSKQDWAGAAAALPAAQAAAQGTDAKYFIGSQQLVIGQGTQNVPMQIEGINAMLANGASTQDQPRLYRALGSFQYQTKNYDGAADAFSKAVQLNPADQESAMNIVKIRGMQKRYPEAIASMETIIAERKAAGQKPAEDDYKLALQYSLDGKVAPKTASLSRELVSAYPTAENWKLAIDIYRTTNQLDSAATIDLMRLMRKAKIMEGRDYIELADELDKRGLPGEVKSVLDEGMANGKITATTPGAKELMAAANGKIAADRASLAGLEKTASGAANGRAALGTADAYFGYGDYAKAAGLYRTALQKGSVDANLVNTRLGTALALSGDKAGAEAAFKSVSGAPRGDIAGFWLLWLSQQA